MNVERRKSERHRVPDSTFFMFDHGTNQMAVIKDISNNGLKFQYLPISDDKTDWKMVDIFGSGSTRFHLLGIPCRLIYNHHSLAEHQSFTGARARTGGLKFGRMTAVHKKRLEYAIDLIRVDVA